MFLKYVLIFLMGVSILKESTENDDTEIKLNVRDRIKILETKLKKQIEEEQRAIGNIPSLGIDWPNEENDDYDDNTNNFKPITPIMQQRKFTNISKSKKSVKISKKSNKTNTTKFKINPVRPINKRKKLTQIIKSRRWEGLDYKLNTPVKHIHCLWLLTAFLANITDSLICNNTVKTVGTNDTVVLRLIHLLSVDTNLDTQDDVYSVLYQISNLRLRLFQWDEKAIQLLMTHITKDIVSNFQTLKNGVKNLFHNWHLDMGDASNLLQQARIFRPPCVQTSELSGSTKTSRALSYSKGGLVRRQCLGADAEDDSCAEV